MKRPTIRRGDTGKHVDTLQSWLLKLEYLSGTVDGKFGPKTKKALEDFQTDYDHLTTDGVCGGQSWGALEQAVDDGESDKQHANIPVPDPQPLAPGARGVPEAFWSYFKEIVDAIVEARVGYGPGRGLVNEEREEWVVSIGPNKLQSKNYKTKDPKYGPAFVCSTFTYFLLCVIFRVNAGFKKALAGGMPAFHEVLTNGHEIHPIKESSYGYWGFGPFTKLINGDGSSPKRSRKVSKGRMDLLEIYARRESLGDILFASQSSVKKDGKIKWDHHTACFFIDRTAPGMPIYRIAADGYKAKGGVFSGTDMNIETLTKEYCEQNYAKTFYKLYALVPEAIVAHGITDRPAWPIVFELDDVKGGRLVASKDVP